MHWLTDMFLYECKAGTSVNLYRQFLTSLLMASNAKSTERQSPPPAAPGTCQWISDTPEFRSWVREPQSFLLLSADPWCGKSVLAHFLTKNLFLQPAWQSKPVYPCYLRRSQKREDRKKVLDSTLEEIERDLTPVTGTIICVLDAVDACCEGYLRDFAGKLLVKLESKGCELKLIATTRTEKEDSGMKLFDKDKFNFFGCLSWTRKEVRSKLQQDIVTTATKQLQTVPIRGDRKAIFQALQFDGSGRVPYLWLRIVIDGLKELAGDSSSRPSACILVATKGLDNASTQQALTLCRKLLDPTASSNNSTARRLLAIQLKNIFKVCPRGKYQSPAVENNTMVGSNS